VIFVICVIAHMQGAGISRSAGKKIHSVAGVPHVAGKEIHSVAAIPHVAGKKNTVLPKFRMMRDPLTGFDDFPFDI
jgi:hypothetical protein